MGRKKHNPRNEKPVSLYPLSLEEALKKAFDAPVGKDEQTKERKGAEKERDANSRGGTMPSIDELDQTMKEKLKLWEDARHETSRVIEQYIVSGPVSGEKGLRWPPKVLDEKAIVEIKNAEAHEREASDAYDAAAEEWLGAIRHQQHHGLPSI